MEHPSYVFSCDSIDLVGNKNFDRIHKIYRIIISVETPT
ncbi:MAG: hypothetical protein ACI9EW_004033, partial [Cellvibrionaceae bacterium]